MAADRVAESQQQHLSCADWRLQVVAGTTAKAAIQNESWKDKRWHTFAFLSTYTTCSLHQLAAGNIAQNIPKSQESLFTSIYSLLFKRCIHPLCDWCLSNIDGILLLRLRSLLLTREHIPHDAQNLAHSQQTHHRKAENLTSIVAIPPLSISCQQPQEKPTVKLSIWLRFECWGCGWQPMRLRDGTNDLQLGPLLPQFGWVINSNHL